MDYTVTGIVKSLAEKERDFIEVVIDSTLGRHTYLLPVNQAGGLSIHTGVKMTLESVKI